MENNNFKVHTNPFATRGFYSIENGAVCRKFVRSGPYSVPPAQFEMTQKHFEEVCNWFRAVDAKLPRTVDASTGAVELTSLPSEPNVPEADLQGDFKEFHDLLGIYNAQVKQNGAVAEASTESDLERTFTFLFPVLLATALALGITKVTGEIALERHKAANSPAQ